MRAVIKTIASMRFRWAIVALVGALVAPLTVTVVRGQLNPTLGAPIRDTDDGIKYARGQNVVPVFEGWVANPDGTFGLVYGSWNRNWEEYIHIPLGPDNKFETGNPDQGQPTFFYPRRGKNHFEITVPKDFGKKELIWAINFRGKVEKAYGVLVAQEVLTRRVVMTGGSLGDQAAAGNDDLGDERDPNKQPSLTFDPAPQVTFTAPGSTRAALNATITDDGLPKPVPGRGGRGGAGLRVNWSVYRGPALVTFEPATTPVPALTGGKVTTNAIFRQPGNYRLRGVTIDGGGLEYKKDIDIVVR